MYRLLSFILKLFLTTTIVCALPILSNAESKKLRVYLDWFPNVEFAGIYAAIEKGWYKKAGIDLEIMYGGLDIIPQVEAGNANIGLAQAHDLIGAVSKGSKIKAFAANYQMSPVCILVGQDTNIKSIKDLKGKTLGIFSSQEYDIYKIMLATNGLSLKDVKFKKINILKEMDVMKLMKTHEVDAITAWEFNWGLTFSMLGYNVRVFPADKNGFHYYGVVFFGATDFLQQNKNLLDLFLKVTYDGWREVYKNPDYYSDFMVNKYYPKDHYLNNSLSLTLKQQRLELRLRERYFRQGVGMGHLGQMSNFKWLQSLDIAKKYEMIPRKSQLTVNDIIDSRFLPNKMESQP